MRNIGMRTEPDEDPKWKYLPLNACCPLCYPSTGIQDDLDRADSTANYSQTRTDYCPVDFVAF